MSEIGKIIRRLRKQQGITQEQLALAIGYSDRSSIAKIESGKTEVSQSQIKKISDVLHVSPLVLLGYEQNEEIEGNSTEVRNTTIYQKQHFMVTDSSDKYKKSLNEEGQKRLDEFYQFLLQHYGIEESGGGKNEIPSSDYYRI